MESKANHSMVLIMSLEYPNLAASGSHELVLVLSEVLNAGDAI